MKAEQEQELAEVILRTRRWAFREAFPEILGVVRQIADSAVVPECQASREGAERMIRDYRALITRLPHRPAA